MSRPAHSNQGLPARAAILNKLFFHRLRYVLTQREIPENWPVASLCERSDPGSPGWSHEASHPIFMGASLVTAARSSVDQPA